MCTETLKKRELLSLEEFDIQPPVRVRNRTLKKREVLSLEEFNSQPLEHCGTANAELGSFLDKVRG